jgi:hypothetical protein
MRVDHSHVRINDRPQPAPTQPKPPISTPRSANSPCEVREVPTRRAPTATKPLISTPRSGDSPRTQPIARSHRPRHPARHARSRHPARYPACDIPRVDHSHPPSSRLAAAAQVDSRGRCRSTPTRVSTLRGPRRVDTPDLASSHVALKSCACRPLVIDEPSTHRGSLDLHSAVRRQLSGSRHAGLAAAEPTAPTPIAASRSPSTTGRPNAGRLNHLSPQTLIAQTAVAPNSSRVSTSCGVDTNINIAVPSPPPVPARVDPPSAANGRLTSAPNRRLDRPIRSRPPVSTS